MSTSTRLMTAEEFFLLPDDPSAKHVLNRGEVETMSFAGGRHADIAGQIVMLLKLHVRPNRLGKVYTEAGFIIERDPDTVNGPDAAFVSRERLALITSPEKFLPFAPDLAVEIASPNDRRAEIARKTARWLAAGTKIVWNVDPEEQTVAISTADQPEVTLAAAETLTGGDVLPGFACLVGDFFEE